jgi:hypothetical protein
MQDQPPDESLPSLFGTARDARLIAQNTLRRDKRIAAPHRKSA